MQLQMASLGLTIQSPLLQLPSLPSCGAMGLPPPPTFIPLPFVHQPDAAGPSAGAVLPPQMQMQAFHLPMAGGAPSLSGLPFGWAMAGGDSGAAATAAAAAAAASQLAPASSGMRQAPSSRPQQGHQQGGPQQEASAPQIMSNTDVGGSTEGTQAWGGGGGPADGGGNRSGSGRGAEGDESGAAESRLKAPAGSRRAAPSEPRKSRFK
jgi:hypothetical protein